MKTTPLIRLITYLNILVFIAWFASMSKPMLFNWMVSNFLVSWDALLAGRYWVLITSVFSHSTFFHLLINMFILRGFGIVIVKLIGPQRFMLFYLLAGISGSLVHAIVSNLLMASPELPALGASGAIAGIILFFSIMFPDEKLLLLGLIPIKARWAALLIVGIDLWGLFEQTKGGGLAIGHGAHLGGALIGIIYALTMKNSHIRSIRPFS